MKISLLLLLVSASLLASFGQLLLKVGASNADSLLKFINFHILGGLVFYGLSTAIWIYALSSTNLNVVYAFTTLTFVLVYLLAALFLKEPLNIFGIAGVLCVLVGIYLIAVKGTT